LRPDIPHARGADAQERARDIERLYRLTPVGTPLRIKCPPVGDGRGREAEQCSVLDRSILAVTAAIAATVD